MIGKEFKHLLKSKGLIITMAIVLLVPILYAGTFLKSVWNPYDNTQNLKVGVVNLDNKVEFEGKTLEVGSSMVNKLKENKKVNWQFVDKDKAEKELREGDYYMVVTIPENFSKNATTLSSENPEKMNIDFKTNFTKSKNGEKIMETVATNLTNTVKEQVIKTYSTILYSKFAEVGSSLEKAADGSKELNSGLTRLNDGGEKLAGGVSKLYNGSATLNNGLSKLNDKKTVLINGVTKLHDGSSELKNGIIQYTNGVLTINEKLLGKKADLEKLTAGGNTLVAGVDELANGVPQLTTGANTLNNGLSTLNDNKTILVNGVTQLSEGSNKFTLGLNQFKEKSVMLADSVSKLTNGSNKIQEGFIQYSNGVVSLNEGLSAKKEDLSRLNTGGDILASGVNKLVEGVPQLANGASELNAGINAINLKLPSANTISEKKAKIESLTNQLSYLKIKSGQINNRLSSKFENLGKEISKLENVKVTSSPTQKEVNFSSLKQQLDATALSEAEKNNILAAAQNDVASTQTPQDNSNVQTEINNIMNSSLASYLDLYSTLEELAKLKNQIEKVDVTALKSELNNSFDQYDSLKDAINKLSVGSSRLSAGLTDMNKQTPTLSSGFNNYKNGVDNLATTLTNGELAQGISKLANNTPDLQNGFSSLNNGLNSLNNNVPDISKGIDQLFEANTKINTGVIQLQSKIPALSIGIEKLNDGSQKLYKGLSNMNAKAPVLVAGFNKYKSGVDELTSSMTAGELAQGVNKLTTKTPDLQNGITRLSDGINQLYGSVPELSTGIEELYQGGKKLHTGLSDMNAKAPELINGMKKAKEGSAALSDKLSAGAEKVNSAHTGDKNSDMLANPIKTNTSDIAHETAYGNAMAPFFLVFGLLIAASIFNVLFPGRKREEGESTNSLFITRLVSMSTFIVIAAIIEVISMKLFFDFKIEYFGMYFFGLIVSGIVFMIISHFLSYTFGKVGNGLSIGFVALQFVLTTPLFPKELLPTLYSGLIPFTPVYYGDMAVRHAVLGGLTNGIYNNAITILISVGIIFLILTYVSYNRKNKATLSITAK